MESRADAPDVWYVRVPAAAQKQQKLRNEAWNSGSVTLPVRGWLGLPAGVPKEYKIRKKIPIHWLRNKSDGNRAACTVYRLSSASRAPPSGRRPPWGTQRLIEVTV